MAGVHDAAYYGLRKQYNEMRLNKAVSDLTLDKLIIKESFELLMVTDAGLEASDHETHTLRRPRVDQPYRNTENLRAVQQILGHSKTESTIRNLGIELEDALSISEILEK